jgi:hypothetical protein
MQYPLVMTATIDTKGMNDLSISDAGVRERQYRDTLSFYLQSGWVKEIVFIENSGYDLTCFQELAKAYPMVKTEVISCSLNDYPRELGKSYGEMRLLDYVLDNSKAVALAGGFIKVTGRFPFLNLNKLLLEAKRRQPWVLFCDTKDHPIYDWLRNGWNGHAADTRFFIVTTEFYRKHFYGKYHELNDSIGALVEGLFFDVIQEQHGCEMIVRRFKTEPEPAGQAGHRQISIIGTNDYSGRMAKSKRRIRQFGRWFFPWFWF